MHLQFHRTVIGARKHLAWIILLTISFGLYAQTKEDIVWEISSRLHRTEAHFQFRKLWIVPLFEVLKSLDSAEFPLRREFKNAKFHELLSLLDPHVPTRFLSSYTGLKMFADDAKLRTEHEKQNGSVRDQEISDLWIRVRANAKFSNEMIGFFQHNPKSDYEGAIAIKEELKFRLERIKSFRNHNLNIQVSGMESPNRTTADKFESKSFNQLFYQLGMAISQKHLETLHAIRGKYTRLVSYEMYFNFSLDYGTVGIRNKVLDSALDDLDKLSVGLDKEYDSIKNIKPSFIKKESIEDAKLDSPKETHVGKIKIKDSLPPIAIPSPAGDTSVTIIEPLPIEPQEPIETIGVKLARFAVIILISAFAIWKSLPENGKEKIFSWLYQLGSSQLKKTIKQEKTVFISLSDFLKNKGLLYLPSSWDIAAEVYDSLEDIRNTLTKNIIPQLNHQSSFKKDVEHLRDLALTLQEDKTLFPKGAKTNHISINLNSATWQQISSFRSEYASLITKLATKYDVDCTDLVQKIKKSIQPPPSPIQSSS